MGNQQSHESQLFIQNFNQQYTQIRELNHPRFGDVQIYQNRLTSNLIMTKSYWCQNEIEYKKLISKCETRSRVDQPNLIKLLGYHSNHSNQLCGDFTKVSVYFEYSDQTLEKEINNRYLNNSYFQEAELWNTFYQIIKTEIFLLKNNKLLGNIRSSNIFIENDKQLKLSEDNVFSNEKNQTITQQSIDQAFLSPEQMQQKQGIIIPSEKSDMFSLGLTMLECSTLTPARQFYIPNQNIQFQTIQQQLDQIQSLGYSTTWYRMIREMVQIRPEDRPSFQDILVYIKCIKKYQGVLQPFENQIQNFQAFSFVDTIQQKPLIQPTYQPQEHRSHSQYYPSNSLPQTQYENNPQYGLVIAPQSQLPLQPQQYQQPQQIPSNSSQIYQQPQVSQYKTTAQKPFIQYPQAQQIPYGQHNQSQQNLIQMSPQRNDSKQPYYDKNSQDQLSQFHLNSNEKYPYSQQQPNEIQSLRFSPQKTQCKIFKLISKYIESKNEEGYHPGQNLQQNQPQIQYFSQNDHIDQGLSELDMRIQRALKSSQETANRHYQTPSYQ